MYTVDYFIEKFKAIPEDKWCEDGSLHDGFGRHCAYGHCGKNGAACAEGACLSKLFRVLNHDGGAAFINDGYNDLYQQPTPKQRILAALYDIKNMQYPELSNTTVEDLISEPYKRIEQREING